MDEPLINPRTGQVVTRIVKAKRRDARRDVVLIATGEVVNIIAHNYNPAVHAALDYSDAPTEEQQPAKKQRRKRAKKKAQK